MTDLSSARLRKADWRQRILLTPAECAEWLRHETEWFYRNHKRLEAEYGYPLPVPGCGNARDPGAIDAWLDSFIPTEQGITLEGEIIDYDELRRARLPGIVSGGQPR